MDSRFVRVAALALASLVFAGCTGQLSSEVPPPPWQTPSATSAATPAPDTWFVEMTVDASVAGKAVLTYADATTKTVEFSGPETHFSEETAVPLGGKVSISVTLDEVVPADADPAMCGIAGANSAMGTDAVILTSNGDQRGKSFACTWTNDKETKK